ncbi:MULTISPECIES: methionine ABC transporter ATP-binding protein [unclassified Treponema]|uniref:methionine ABC transporter ATP-binding protein n=1 Tax=unclassified Treponema TaxID=2638727 RepID=UPI0005300CE2|nr:MULTISPECIES: methionine ABC transporter ATP-binding protein [unclassified Treponema]AIW89465.1 phosphate ABC transporter ATP-binding protein [Treponema sp. OMZ 838]UTC42856.1 methionine ABC transporter ATP-binding protein [Treponema sp. OMZ 857]
MIRLVNVNKRYGELQAVDNISLEIPSHTIFGIIGKSGAGKSTLVRLISLLEPVDSGEIYYGDSRVDTLTGKLLRNQHKKIGMIFQNFNLFASRTAAGNIAYPLEIAGMPKRAIAAKVEEMLHVVGLEGRGDARVSTLSGGQKQRVAIARALAVSPDILFCDEATSALDPQTTRSILELLKRLQKDMNLSVVMITHQMEVVRDCCQQVAVIDNGAVAETGSVREIFSAPKSEVTKDFLMHINPLNPEDTQLIRWSKSGGAYTLRFSGELTSEPVLSKISRDYNIEFNICAGGMQKVGETVVGTLFVDINGSPEDMQKAFAYLNQNGIKVEETRK